ncbi:MAG: UvrD-helicase domain-containing protein, partial [Candidatus Zixiibacteriota bacterium]
MAKFPSEEQEKVILHSGRPLIVIAAPGTGKTSTIVARMIRLLKEDLNREVSFITFTRTSRRDTDKKVTNEFDKKALEKAGTSFPRISTLHTYAKSIVHKHASQVGRQPSFSVLIDDRGERNLLLSELIDDLKIKIDPLRLQKELVCYRCTGSFRSDCDLPPNTRKKLLKHLEILLRFYNTFDMEGLVLSACDIISSNDVVLPAIFLQVDEYQDLNPADQKLISLISSIKGSQVVVVGDDAQSIYPFRHANPDGIRELWNSSDWEKVKFTNCHRLPPHILRAAQSLISKENYLGGKVK